MSADLILIARCALQGSLSHLETSIEQCFENNTRFLESFGLLGMVGECSIFSSETSDNGILLNRIDLVSRMWLALNSQGLVCVVPVRWNALSVEERHRLGLGLWKMLDQWIRPPIFLLPYPEPSANAAVELILAGVDVPNALWKNFDKIGTVVQRK